jgi:hypothetical protein
MERRNFNVQKNHVRVDLRMQTSKDVRVHAVPDDHRILSLHTQLGQRRTHDQWVGFATKICLRGNEAQAKIIIINNDNIKQLC